MSNKFLYITADRIDTVYGGGPTVKAELEALRSLGEVDILNPPLLQPFEQDAWALEEYRTKYRGNGYKLAHSYAGTWTQLVRQLCEDGIPYTSTCAAHDPSISQREHKKLGLPFPYPHLTDPGQFHAYTEHLRLANLVIAPGSYPQDVLSRQGIGRTRIVPHGYDGPKEIKPLPKQLTFGYMGSAGSDKGLMYLLEAWKQKPPKDAVLHLGGLCCEVAAQIIKQNGIKNIVLKGVVKNISDFYNDIAAYISPSTTEGFHLPVLEAMAHGRMAFCSKNAGAADMASLAFEACNVNVIAEILNQNWQEQEVGNGKWAFNKAQEYTVAKQKEKYIAVWKEAMATTRPPLYGDGKLKLHIGSFVSMIPYGWVNVDVLPLQTYAKINGYKFVERNMTQPLPWPDNSVDLIFSHHSLEHITWGEAVQFIADCHRIMKPGAVMRIVVPSLEGLIQDYQDGNMDKHSDNEGVNGVPIQATKFWNLLTAGHRNCFDWYALKHLGKMHGFKVTQCDFRDGNKQILEETYEFLPESLFVEFEK